MKAITTAVLALVVAAPGAKNSAAILASSGPSRQSAQPSNAMRQIGAIKTINGNTIVMTTDAGAVLTVTVLESARVLRIAPGEKTLKNATPIQLTDLQVGDRVLIGGKAADDSKSLTASSVVVMKGTDVEARHQQELQDWQKRGLNGIVTAVDPAAGVVTVSTGALNNKKSVAVHKSQATIVRRYAPDSVKFEDAKPGSLQEIHAGDQLRARGDRTADGSELTAEEIVTGTFHNIAGTVNSVDAASGIINIQDLLSRKQVQVRVTGDSQLHKLPTEMAQRFAMRLKGAAAGQSGQGAASSPGQPATSATSGQGPEGGSGASQGVCGGGGMGGGMRSGGSPDLQQVLSHSPAIAVADLHKGDAVVVLTTEGSPSSAGTAITLVSGVEPILQAAPNASQAMMLAPWSLSEPGGGEAASQ